MSARTLALAALALVTSPSLARAAAPPPAAPPLSAETEKCLGCHEAATPGIVADWRSSRHSTTTPEKAMQVPAASRRLSAAKVPDAMAKVVVGCFECHGQNAATHKDDFAHKGFRVHPVVTPADCKTCHTDEAAQFAHSKKANAFANLEKNAVYHGLVDAVVSVKELKAGKLVAAAEGATAAAKADTCLACHGTEIKVKGLKTVELEDGEIKVPDLEGWPNHGVGRVNPDGSLGTCSACHARHSFSIEVARKPATCAQCHQGPDVPAFEVWTESKHGNLADSTEGKVDWEAIPWVPGADFKAPTCAACHNAKIADKDGNVIVERTHDFGARLWVRLFGLPYSHPQPKDGDTTTLKSKDGLPLPTSLAGEPAAAGLIDAKEQASRRAAMGKVCGACHATSYAQAHFAKLDRAIAEADKLTLTATGLLQKGWANKVAEKTNLFDETLEHRWVEQWLIHANSIRYSSAMSGQDLGTFGEGRWNATKGLKEMESLAAGKK